MPVPRLTFERAHESAGRLRLRLGAGQDGIDLARLADRIAEIPAVTRVRARPATGSVIIEHSGPTSDLVDSLVASLGARIVAPPSPPPVAQVMQLGLMQLDTGLRARTDSTIDLRGLMVLLLLFGAVVQLARGRIAGPATTLALAAFSLLDLRRGP